MKYSVLLVFLLFSMCILGQKKYMLRFTGTAYTAVKKNPETRFKDSLEAIAYAKELRLFAIKKGYLLASLDSLHFSNNEVAVSFFTGPKFKNANLSISPKNLSFIRQHGSFNEKLLRHLPFRPRELAQILEQIQFAYENNGYPFCKVYLDSIHIDGENLRAEITVDEERQLRITKINLVGNPLISKKLVSSYIQIYEGDLFNQAKINLISAKLKQISFVVESKPSEILFTPDGVELFLYLKARPVSLINGVVGLQPNPIQNKVSLTGELRMKLVNIFRKAELFELNWRSIQAQTQSLKIQTVLPNMFQTPFGFDGEFQLYKRDSTFLELKTTLGVQYALNQGNFLKAFYRRYSSNILSSGFSNPNFSNLKSVETNFYGLALSRQSVDYLPNPRNGFILLLEGTIGIRKTLDLAQTISQKTYKGELQFQWYFPLYKRHVLKLSNFSEAYFAPTYFQNEQYRFGGQISLRGFNEEAIYATARSVTTLEYRFLLDKNSFLFAFYDQAWYENKASTQFVTDTPLGFGAGFTFGTNIGNFSVSYALGKQFSNPIKLNEGKVHFGYIAYF